jgi:hypothetical protein
MDKTAAQAFYPSVQQVRMSKEGQGWMAFGYLSLFIKLEQEYCLKKLW